MSGLISMNPPARSAHNELLGKKKASSVLVRGFSALELAKQAGLVPSNWTEPQFIAWLRAPATEAAAAANALVATIQSTSNIILANLEASANATVAEHTAALEALEAANEAELISQLAAHAEAVQAYESFLMNENQQFQEERDVLVAAYEQQLNDFNHTTTLYLNQLEQLIADAAEGEYNMADLQVITDVLALRTFGVYETVGTGAEQTMPLPINGLMPKNVHIHWEGSLQSYTEHSIVDNVLHFTAPVGMDVQITIS